MALTLLHATSRSTGSWRVRHGYRVASSSCTSLKNQSSCTLVTMSRRAAWPSPTHVTEVRQVPCTARYITQRASRRCPREPLAVHQSANQPCSLWSRCRKGSHRVRRHPSLPVVPKVSVRVARCTRWCCAGPSARPPSSGRPLGKRLTPSRSPLVRVHHGRFDRRLVCRLAVGAGAGPASVQRIGPRHRPQLHSGRP